MSYLRLAILLLSYQKITDELCKRKRDSNFWLRYFINHSPTGYSGRTEYFWSIQQFFNRIYLSKIRILGELKPVAQNVRF
ncbi:hypothetical protein [Tolypothrix campylonemoides]|uniref:hypothetical protein n=1 Tax=Tolypothrix campylonemoides TaxID=1136105 RepID=UPI0038B6A0C5